MGYSVYRNKQQQKDSRHKATKPERISINKKLLLAIFLP